MSQTVDMSAMLFGDLEPEFANTRRMLEKVPGDRLDYRPHEKSFTLGELATHIANLPTWLTSIVGEDEYDLATLPADRNEALDPEAMLQKWDTGAATVREAVARVTAEGWSEPWTLRSGDTVYFTMPRAAVTRTMGINHIVHHRAQLSVYLRLLDVPVPGMYGPSADES